MKAITLAMLTDTTCGEACWHAKEAVCRCCCGGKNHGILTTPDGIQPCRTSKIDGYRYELLSVGSPKDLRGQAKALLKDVLKSQETVTAQKWDAALGKFIDSEMLYRYWWTETEAGSPFRLKLATPLQAAHWPELSAYKDMDTRDWYFNQPALLWRRLQEGTP